MQEFKIQSYNMDILEFPTLTIFRSKIIHLLFNVIMVFFSMNAGKGEGGGVIIRISNSSSYFGYHFPLLDSSVHYCARLRYIHVPFTKGLHALPLDQSLIHIVF